MENETKRTKEREFLRWKWGFKEENSNYACEKTRQEILHIIVDAGGVIRLNEAQRGFFKGIILFESECNEKRIRLGLEPRTAVKRLMREEF